MAYGRKTRETSGHNKRTSGSEPSVCRGCHGVTLLPSLGHLAQSSVLSADSNTRFLRFALSGEKIEGFSMRKGMVIAAIVLGIMVLTVSDAKPAGAAKIGFGPSSVTLTIPSPTPSCRPTHRTTSCEWTLLVVEDATKAIMGQATGLSGVLSVPYPTTCGTIRAAVVIGPPMRTIKSFRHTITAPCSAPVPAPLPTTAPTLDANAPSEPVASQAGGTDNSGGTQLASATSSGSLPPSAGTQMSPLPFTGAPILDLLTVGIACLILAAWCLRPALHRPRASVVAVDVLAPGSVGESTHSPGLYANARWVWIKVRSVRA